MIVWFLCVPRWRLSLMALSFSSLRLTNTARCEQSFHGIDRWTPTDWATAMAGECGEACNEIKKLRRLQTNPEWNDPQDKDGDAIVGRIAHELADLVIYADLLASRLGIDLGKAVAEKFNLTSEKVGSSFRLIPDDARATRAVEAAAPEFVSV